MNARGASIVLLVLAAAPAVACTGSNSPDVVDDIATNDASDIVIGDASDIATDTPDVVDAAPDVPPVIETAPRAIAPMTSATVTSHRPTFHFIKPEGFGEVTVEICAARDCATIEQTLPTTDLAIRATADLTPGAHWWRLRDGTRTTTPWWFWVNVRDTVTDTSFGSEADVNGDGLPEIVVGANHAGTLSQGRVYVFPSTRGQFGTSAATVLDGTENNSHFGWWVGSAGDVNGDGFVDLVVGAPDVEIYNGRAYVFSGSATGVSTTADTTIPPAETMGNFGAVTVGAGDVNGDGYGDVMVGAPNTDVSRGSAFLYLGSRDGLRTVPALILHGPDGRGTAFGSALAPIGDVNADGYADVVVGANGAMSGAGRAYIYLGSRSGLGNTPAVILDSPAGSGSQFASFVSGAGDVNGDGYTDLAIGATGTTDGNAYVFLGGASVSTMAHVSLDGPDGALGGFGWSVAAAGDLNHDGFDDIALSAVCAPWTQDNDGGYPHCGAGRGYVFYGASNAIAMTPSVSIEGPEGMEGAFGWSMSGVGDVDGDGIVDMAASAYAINTFFGAAYVFPGNAAGLSPTPAATLRGTAGTSEDFGWCIASRRIRGTCWRG